MIIRFRARRRIPYDFLEPPVRKNTSGSRTHRRRASLEAGPGLVEFEVVHGNASIRAACAVLLSFLAGTLWSRLHGDRRSVGGSGPGG